MGVAGSIAGWGLELDSSNLMRQIEAHINAAYPGVIGELRQVGLDIVASTRASWPRSKPHEARGRTAAQKARDRVFQDRQYAADIKARGDARHSADLFQVGASIFATPAGRITMTVFCEAWWAAYARKGALARAWYESSRARAEAILPRIAFALAGVR